MAGYVTHGKIDDNLWCMADETFFSWPLSEAVSLHVYGFKDLIYQYQDIVALLKYQHQRRRMFLT